MAVMAVMALGDDELELSSCADHTDWTIGERLEGYLQARIMSLKCLAGTLSVPFLSRDGRSSLTCSMIWEHYQYCNRLNTST